MQTTLLSKNVLSKFLRFVETEVRDKYIFYKCHHKLMTFNLLAALLFPKLLRLVKTGVRDKYILYKYHHYTDDFSSSRVVSSNFNQASTLFRQSFVLSLSSFFGY